jgi:hypothetical protein
VGHAPFRSRLGQPSSTLHAFVGQNGEPRFWSRFKAQLKFIHPYVNQLQGIYVKLTLRHRHPGYRRQPEMATSQRVFLHPHNRNNYQLTSNR